MASIDSCSFFFFSLVLITHDCMPDTSIWGNNLRTRMVSSSREDWVFFFLQVPRGSKHSEPPSAQDFLNHPDDSKPRSCVEIASRVVAGGIQDGGTHVYLWLIHVDVWKNITILYKVFICQVKLIFFKLLLIHFIPKVQAALQSQFITLTLAGLYFSLVSLTPQGYQKHSSFESQLHPTGKC